MRSESTMMFGEVTVVLAAVYTERSSAEEIAKALLDRGLDERHCGIVVHGETQRADHRVSSGGYKVVSCLGDDWGILIQPGPATGGGVLTAILCSVGIPEERAIECEQAVSRGGALLFASGAVDVLAHRLPQVLSEAVVSELALQPGSTGPAPFEGFSQAAGR